MANGRRACSRRRFLTWAAAAGTSGVYGCSGGAGPGDVAATGGWLSSTGGAIPAGGSGGDVPVGTGGAAGAEATGGASGVQGPRVALVRCESYVISVVTEALRLAFDRIGGLAPLVKSKTVTVKVNLTGNEFTSLFGLPPGETYLTHDSTAVALAALLFEAGARRVRFVESAPYVASLPEVMTMAGWDAQALSSVGNVEFENTRNLGSGGSYARVPVPDGGRLHSYFELNRAYVDTDVFVSLAKMKQHVIAGLTLSLKNLFGVTPNSLYSDQTYAGEGALGYRGPMHAREGHAAFPGEIDGYADAGPEQRVPRIITDLCAARPVHLSIVDGITSMRGGEGPWNPQLSPVAPGLLAVGFDPVATDAVCAAVMGFDPRGWSLTPSSNAENHILLAEAAGLGTADLNAIELPGLSVEEALYPF
ncbi:MAG: DUF362 domain-containing protein [Myxococcales bacterium]|nr:DUF362 domain-containing protein [Myxococcales bacterium]